MILVTLGTQDKPFPRLLEAVEKQLQKGIIKEEVVVQAGSTKFSSNYMKIFDYMSIAQFNELLEKADLIITHGGVGTIISGIKLGKKVIAAARLKQYEEHTNDHQLQIIENFSEEGYIIPLNDFNHLEEAIERTKKFVPKPFNSNTNCFIEQLRQKIM